jgi:hypothetical protein
MSKITLKETVSHLLMALLFLISSVGMAQEPFCPVLPANAGKTQSLNFHGIPFKVIPTDKGFTNLAVVSTPLMAPNQNQVMQSVFFLGMVTEKPEGSEWC